MSEKFKLQFIGGVGSTSGVSFLLEGAGKKILIDAGLKTSCEPGDNSEEEFPYKPSEIDYVFVSHSHLEHSGRVPEIIKNGFNGAIYSTSDTKAMADLVMIDCLGAAGEEESAYSQADLDKAMSLWRTEDYEKDIDLGEGLTVTMYDDGHVLGSALFVFKYNGKRLLFANALGNPAALEFRNLNEEKDVEYAVIESVYGDKSHEITKEREEYLEDIIEETVNRKGTVLIPVSSIDKIFTVLHEVDKLREEGRVPVFPIYVDSTIAAKAVGLYAKLFKCDCGTLEQFVERLEGLHFITNEQESEEMMKVEGSKIVIGGISTLSEKRFDTYLSKYITNPNSSIVFIDFQPSGSVGRLLQEGKSHVVVHGGEDVEVGAQIETIDGYSSHSDHNGLFKFVDDIRSDNLRKVFVAVGEPKASMYLVQRLRDYLGVNTKYPKTGDIFELEF